MGANLNTEEDSSSQSKLTRTASKPAMRRRQKSAKESEPQSSGSMLKWDSWNDALDANKLDADAAGNDGTMAMDNSQKEDFDFAKQYSKDKNGLSGKIRSEKEGFRAIREHIKKYAHPDLYLAVQTLVVTLGLYVLSVAAYYYLWNYGCGPNTSDNGVCYEKYGTLWRVAYFFIRAGILVRAFILFHDTCHLSYWKTPKQNRFWGRLVGSMILTPYEYWRGTHVLHHRVYGNSALYDPARTIKFTVQEYQNMPLWKKALCRFFRDPFVFFIVAPFMLFMVVYRFMRGGGMVNAFKIIEYTILVSIMNAGTVWIKDELMASVAGGALGFMLFHLQHHINISYYEPPAKHTVEEASIYGSTYLIVPWFMKWVTLGIEYHHIHHFNMRVPCYLLQKCHEEAPKGMWKDVPTLPYSKSFRGLFNAMWNPETYRYESFWPYEGILMNTLGE